VGISREAAEVSRALVRELGSSVQFLPESKFLGDPFGRSLANSSSRCSEKGSGLQTAEYRLASDQSIGLRRH
jgi:hypothetical protein